MFDYDNLESNKYNPWESPALVATASALAGLILIGMTLGLGLGIGLNNDEQNLTLITETTIPPPPATTTTTTTAGNSKSINISRHIFSLFDLIANTLLITSTFSNSLSNSNTTYSPPHLPIPGHYYYDAFRLTVATFGNYTIRSSSVTGTNLYGYLYINNFDPLNPSSNLIASDDNSGGNQQFQFTIALQSTFTTSKTNKYHT